MTDPKYFLAGVLIIFVFSLPASPCPPPPDTSYYNAGFQLTINLGGKKDIKDWSNVRLNLTFGAGRLFWRAVMPAYQMSINFYNGGFGSSRGKTERFQIDWVNSFALTAGWDVAREHRHSPLYFFNGWAAHALTNPFRGSATLATNFILNNHRKNQQFGLLVLKAGGFDVGYYNEGPFFDALFLGDGFDRWWTGGAFLHANIKDHHAYVSFDKFTGFVPDAFEIANLIKLDYVPYSKPIQAFYNYVQWQARWVSPEGYSLQLIMADQYGADFQNWIHFPRFQSFHPPIFKPSWYVGFNDIKNYDVSKFFRK